MKYLDNVRLVTPYTPGEQPQVENIIKLNTNECPYQPSSAVGRALGELEYENFRLYPDPNCSILVEAIAKRYNLKNTQVFVGVGSDEVLALAFLTFFNSKKPILFPDITYSFYDVWADLYKVPYERIALNDDFAIDKSDYINRSGLNGGIIFPNPNAPTGVLESIDTIEEIIVANRDVVVIIDEAYIDFGGVSALSLIEKYDNLLVVQTYSKSRAMAGMRIGYAMGNEKLIKYLLDVKFSFNSYTMNMPALKTGVAVLEDEMYFREVTQKIITTRERVSRELIDLGFVFPKSYANFIFASHPKYKASDLYNALKEANIFVRYFNKDRIDNYLRITIGTDEQMDAFLSFVKNYVSEGKNESN